MEQERLEKLLKKHKSSEEKAIISLLPVLEKDFTIMYKALSKYDIEFAINDSLGQIAAVKVKKGKVDIVEGKLSRGHIAKYRLRIKSNKNKVSIKVIESNEICEDFFIFSNRSLEKFLRICAKQYKREPYRIEQRLKRISSLPAACLQYLNDGKSATNPLSFVTEIKEKSAKLLQSVDISKYYYNDSETFKTIFEKLDEGQKKAVLKQLIINKESRKELDKWLEETCPKLIKEAGRDVSSIPYNNCQNKR